MFIVMPWSSVIPSLLQSLASSGRSSKDQSYNIFLRSIASKVMSDSAKSVASENFRKFIDNG